MATTTPIAGQRSPSSTVEPSSTTTDGSSAISSVSFSRSIAHMPRVILRTIEPAKVLACHSVEKRCTRQNASRASAVMMCSVSRMMPRNARCRSTINTSPSNSMAPSAASAAWRAASRSTAIAPTASTRRPAKIGISTSAAVAPISAAAVTAVSAVWRRQWRQVNPSTSRKARMPRFVRSWVTGSIRCRWRGDRSLSQGSDVATVPKGPSAGLDDQVGRGLVVRGAGPRTGALSATGSRVQRAGRDSACRPPEGQG